MLKSAIAILLMAPLSDTEAQPAAPMRPLIEELRIDGKSHDWKEVGAVRVGPGGHVLVGERLGKSIRVFSPDGQLVRTLGRRGQGPGEFSGADDFGVLGDTIWVGDRALARLTFFDPSGTLLGTTRMDSGFMPVRDANGKIVHRPRLQAAAPVALYRDGTALVPPLMFPDDADTLGHISVYPYWRTTWSGRVIDTVIAVVVESPLVRITARDGSRRNFLPNSFPQRAHAAASADGRRLAVVEASFSGRDAWSYGVRLVDETRRELYARRFPFMRAPVSRQVVDSLVEVMTERYKNYTGIREAMPVPPSHSPVTKVLVAKDGSVWLRGRADPAGASWTILDPKGNAVALIREPANTRFVEIDGGLWAIERDADDVESIIRYRVAFR